MIETKAQISLEETVAHLNKVLATQDVSSHAYHSAYRLKRTLLKVRDEVYDNWQSCDRTQFDYFMANLGELK